MVRGNGAGNGAVQRRRAGIWLALLLCACQAPGPRAKQPVGLAEVRQSLGMSATDTVLFTHRVLILGTYDGAEGSGTFERSYEPDGRFATRVQPDRGDGWTERFDGEQLWIEADGQKAYALPPTRAHLARSVEWTLASRWLWSDGSPFERNFSRAPERIPTVQLALGDNPVRPEIELDPGTLQPSALRVPGNPAVQWQFEDWRTRRGFPWPYRMQRLEGSGAATTFETIEVRFEPSMQPVSGFRSTRTLSGTTTFVSGAVNSFPIRRTNSGHILVLPRLDGREVGWFLVDTGTGVNCIDAARLEESGGFLGPDLPDRAITIVGLGGSVPAALHRGGTFELGALRATGTEWVQMDLHGLTEVVGAQLAGVLGGDFFDRAVVEIDFSRQLMSLHDPEAFDGSRVTWRPLRFDGSTPCVYCEFAPQEGGWFRLDSGSDDTVTFHAPWVRRLSLLRHMHNTVQTRLRGIGGEVRGVQGRFPWFEFLGQRFSDPRVTMVEEATGPLANPDLVGNVGVGFLENQRLILDYRQHRLALIPR